MLIPMPSVKMSDFDDGLLPEGTYSFRVHKAKYVPVPRTATANPYIGVQHVVTGPDEKYVGRLLFANYPLPPAKGDYRLKELLDVIRLPVLTDLNELVLREFTALVMIQAANGEWPAKNVIKRHLPFLT